MKTILISFLLPIFLLVLSTSLEGQNKEQVNTAKSSWYLVWQDEFNGHKLDTSKWNILTRETSKHDELQYYVPDEVYVEDGLLRIRSRIRDFGNKNLRAAS